MSSSAISSSRCPTTWPFPIYSLASDAHLNTSSLCLEIQLAKQGVPLGWALLCWEEIWHGGEPGTPWWLPRSLLPPCKRRVSLPPICGSSWWDFLTSWLVRKHPWVKGKKVNQSCPCANKSGVWTYPQPSSEAFQSNSPLVGLVEEGSEMRPKSKVSACSVLHSLCTDVNDCMRCEVVENQVPEGFFCKTANN